MRTWLRAQSQIFLADVIRWLVNFYMICLEKGVIVLRNNRLCIFYRLLTRSNQFDYFPFWLCLLYAPGSRRRFIKSAYEIENVLIFCGNPAGLFKSTEQILLLVHQKEIKVFLYKSDVAVGVPGG